MLKNLLFSDITQTLCQRAGFAPHLVVRTNDFATKLHQVALGTAAAFLPAVRCGNQAGADGQRGRLSAGAPRGEPDARNPDLSCAGTRPAERSGQQVCGHALAGARHSRGLIEFHSGAQSGIIKKTDISRLFVRCPPDCREIHNKVFGQAFFKKLAGARGRAPCRRPQTPKLSFSFKGEEKGGLWEETPKGVASPIY